MNLFLTESGIDIAFRKDSVSLEFLHKQSGSRISGEKKLDSTSNYFVGRNPSQWHAGVAQFEAVRYKRLYAGVDAVFHGNGNMIEYDLLLQPGADLRNIAFRVRGAREIRLQDGNLVLRLSNSEIRWRRPAIYQVTPRGKQLVEGDYQISGSTIRFRVGRHDRHQLLIIDPILDYSTYFGGSGEDLAYAVATDFTNAIYVTGMTQSTNFPVSAGAHNTTGDGLGNVFITKLKPDTGEVLYSTYIGGSGIDGDLAGYVGGIAVDSAGNAFIAGVTRSSDFATTPSAFQPGFGTRDTCDDSPCGDAFVLKLNATGTALVYSSFLGGSNHDQASAIAIDATGAAYVTGTTSSADFPTTANAFQRSLQTEDAFVSKVSPDGSSLMYSTLLGGSGHDISLAIAVDAAGRACIAGTTNSSNFPLHNALDSVMDEPWDAFVTALTPDGSDLAFSTLLGGDGTQQALGIALDTVGDIYLAGYTSSAFFPILNAFQPQFGGGASNGFVTKLKAGGTGIVYSTFLGGRDSSSELDAIAVNSRGEAFVTGTGGSDFPTVNSARPYGGNGDVVLAKLAPDGSAVYWSSFFGGSDYDLASTIAIDSNGNVIIAGQTTSTDIPALTGSPQPSLAGMTDAFIARFSDPTNNEPILSSPKSIQVDEAYVGRPSPPVVHRISNPGNRTLHISQIVPSSNVGIVTDCIAIDPGKSCTLNVYLTPTSAAPATGTFTVYDDAADAPQTFTVHGNGSYGGDLEVVSLTAGNVYLNSGLPTIPMSAVVRNNGPDDTESVVLRISNNVGGSDCNPCGLGNMKTGATSTVRFNRTSNVFGVVPITATVSSSSRTPDLNSTNDSKAVQAAVALYTASPAELTFATQAVNSISAPLRIVFHDLGFGPFHLTFAVSGDFTQTNTCGQSSSTDNGCYVDVAFTPTAARARTGTLSVYESVAGTTQLIPLSGSGALAPFASFSATNLDFGVRMVARTSSARTITLTNTGSAALQIASISVYGDFAQTHNCPVSLNVGASCNISIAFTPLAPGTRTTSLLIQDNAIGNPHSIALTGVGSSSAVTISPAALDFSAQHVGSSSSGQSITLTNIFGAPLHISTVTAPFGFQQINNCATVAADTSCTIDIAFHPEQMGIASGTLRISDDGAGSPRNVPLSGFGIQSILNLDQTSLAFGSVPLNEISATKVVTVSNAGNSTLLFTSIEVTGDFSLLDTCSPALGPGDHCNLILAFQPSQLGLQSGQLLISSDAAPTAKTVALSGTGEIVVTTLRTSRATRSIPSESKQAAIPPTEAQPVIEITTHETKPQPASIPKFPLFALPGDCQGQPANSCESESNCEQPKDAKPKFPVEGSTPERHCEQNEGLRRKPVG